MNRTGYTRTLWKKLKNQAISVIAFFSHAKFGEDKNVTLWRKRDRVVRAPERTSWIHVTL